MPKAGEIRYCPELGGKKTNAAFVWIPPGSFWMGQRGYSTNTTHFVTISKGFWLQQAVLRMRQWNKTHEGPEQVIMLWDEWAEFCRTSNFRLPTLAELEYAMRACTGHKYKWSNTNNSPKALHHRRSDPIYNLRDESLSGSEWCHDRMVDSALLPTQPQVDPRGTESSTMSGSKTFSDEVFRIQFRASQRGKPARLIWEPQHD